MFTAPKGSQFYFYLSNIITSTHYLCFGSKREIDMDTPPFFKIVVGIYFNDMLS